MKRYFEKFPQTHIISIIVVIVFISGCATYQPGSFEDPGGLNMVSQSQEIEIGMQASREIETEMRIIDDPYIQNYVNNMGHYLVQYSRRPNLSYQFKVVDTDEINAFALPGGFIYVNRGLIVEAGNEAELAGVLAHEIGHVAARHGAKRMTTLILYQFGVGFFDAMSREEQSTQIGFLVTDAIATGVLLRNSRSDERQADDYGTENLYLAGYDPLGMARFFDKLSRDYSPGKVEVFLSTHPSPGERVRNVQRLVATFSPKSYVADSPEFQQVKYRLSSANFRTSPHQGYSRSNLPGGRLRPQGVGAYRRR